MPLEGIRSYSGKDLLGLDVMHVLCEDVQSGKVIGLIRALLILHRIIRYDCELASIQKVGVETEYSLFIFRPFDDSIVRFCLRP